MQQQQQQQQQQQRQQHSLNKLSKEHLKARCSGSNVSVVMEDLSQNCDIPLYVWKKLKSLHCERRYLHYTTSRRGYSLPECFVKMERCTRGPMFQPCVLLEDVGVD